MCFADKCYIFVYKNIWTIPIAIETIRETMAIIFEIRASFLAATVSAFAISSCSLSVAEISFNCFSSDVYKRQLYHQPFLLKLNLHTPEVLI